MHNWTGRTVWFLNQILFFNTLLKPIVTEWLYVLITLLCLWGWGKLEGWSGNVCRGQRQRRPIGGSCVADCVIYRWKIRRSQGIKERWAEELKKTELYFKKIFLRLDLYLSNFVGVKSNFGLVANINLAGSPLNLMTN